MMRNRRKMACVLLCLLILAGLWAATGPLSGKHRLYILMYHNFLPEGSQYSNNWILTDTRFREDLQWLADHGYTTVLPSELAAGEPLPDKAVMLTFDDGYRSNYDIVYPLLQEYQAKAVISMVTQYTADQLPSFLTWDMAREMAQSGLVEIGSHSNNLHDDSNSGIRRQKKERRADYQARVFPDLQTSIDLIEENTGAEVRFFAYPSGATDRWAKDFIREHFDVTVTTRHGRANTYWGLYGLPRMNVAMTVPLSSILPE